MGSSSERITVGPNTMPRLFACILLTWPNSTTLEGGREKREEGGRKGEREREIDRQTDRETERNKERDKGGGGRIKV